MTQNFSTESEPVELTQYAIVLISTEDGEVILDTGSRNEMSTRFSYWQAELKTGGFAPEIVDIKLIERSCNG